MRHFIKAGILPLLLALFVCACGNESTSKCDVWVVDLLDPLEINGFVIKPGRYRIERCTSSRVGYFDYSYYNYGGYDPYWSGRNITWGPPMYRYSSTIYMSGPPFPRLFGGYR